MEAVKMPSTSQMKSQIRTASADMPKGADGGADGRDRNRLRREDPTGCGER